MKRLHKSWYSRGYHPHFDSPDVIQMIGFRLADSVPASVLQSLRHELRLRPDRERLEHIQDCLDAGHGKCHLKDERIAAIVEDALLFFDNQRYSLLAWVVMPNHVHVLVEGLAGFPLPRIVQSWKGFSARQANRLLKRKGAFWQRDYYDRFIRNESHYNDAVYYIHFNPVKAGLVAKPEDWPFSSARLHAD